MTAGALRRFLDTYSVVPDLPVAVSFRGFTRLYLAGPDEPTRALARAVLAQLAVFHAPEDLLIAACVSADRRPAWEFLKWLPHALHPTRTDGLGPVRLVAESAVGLEELLDDVLADGPGSTWPRPATGRNSSWYSMAATCPAASTSRPRADWPASPCSTSTGPRRACSTGPRSL